MHKTGFKGKPQFKGIKKDTFMRLFKIAYGDKKLLFIVAIFLMILSVFATVGSSLFLKEIIDTFVKPLEGGSDLDVVKLVWTILSMAGIFIIGICSNYFSSRIMVYISLSTLKKIRTEMFVHTQKLPLKFFDSNKHGEIMSRYTNDTETLRQLLSNSIPSLFISVVTIITVLSVMFITSWQMALVSLAVVFIMVFVTQIIGKKVMKYFMLQQTSVGKVNGYIEEMIEGQKVIKVFNYEENAKENFQKLNNELNVSMKKANGNANMLMPIIVNLGHFNYVILAIIGAIFFGNGVASVATIGVIGVFLQLSKQFNQPVSQISQQIAYVAMGMAGATRIFDILDSNGEVDNGEYELIKPNSEKNEWVWKKKESEELIPLKGDVRFLNVDFGYLPEKQVLFDVSLFAKPGQKIAFVGKTGAGKTTITNLVNRFYDVNKGKITYDGIDINDISKDSLRKSLGMVLQDISLFTGTIKENIKYGKLEATDAEIYEASKLANADKFIMELPNGYDTMIHGNGHELSQGQRQLLAIARTAVANPPVLILDEATSSIDTRTEKIVQEGMDKLMAGRTVFVIAHRLSTIRNAKAIMVVDDGKIIERGNHQELMMLKGNYYQLYTGALELD